MRRWVVGILCSLAGACGGGPRAPEAPVPGESTARAAPAGGPSGELATSAQPDDQVFWLRVRSMARDLPALARYELADDEVKTVLENPQFLMVTLVGEEIARSVDLDAPVDVLLSNDDPLESTLALRPSQDLAKSTELVRREVAHGRFRLEIAGQDEVDGPYCELWESESAGDRILCGPNEAKVVRGAVFFFGRAASLSGGAAFRMEVSGRALWSSVLEELEEEQRALGGASPERAGAELGIRWIRGMFDGNRALVAELDPIGSEAELGFELIYEGASASALKSWFGSDRPRALPDAFFRLPNDSELTFGFAGTDPGTGTEALKARLREFTLVGSENFEVSDADRRDLESVTFEALPADGRFVLALGHDRDGIRELRARIDAAEAEGRAPVAKDLANLAGKLAGWALVGIEADSKAYVKNLRRLVEVYERPFAKKKSAGSGGTNATDRDDDSVQPLVTHLEVSAKLPPNLPKGSLHVRVTFRPNPKYKPPPDGSAPVPMSHDVHLVVVPDGARLWLGFARDEAVAAARARAQLGASKRTAAAGASQLAVRTVAAGTLTLGGLVGLDLGGDTEEERKAARLALAELDALPNRGRSKIPTRLEVVPNADGTSWSVALRGRMPLPAIKDTFEWLSQTDSADGVFQ